MVNFARGETTSYSPEEKVESIGGQEPRGEPSEADPDVSRSDSGETEEIASYGRWGEVSVSRASRVVAIEIYSNGLHHSEVAEKYEVELGSIIWLMKSRGVGFAAQDLGEPPDSVEKASRSLCLGHE